jgi:hypothetical protein
MEMKDSASDRRNRRPSVRPLLIGIAALVCGWFAISYFGYRKVLKEAEFTQSMPVPDDIKKARVVLAMPGLKKRTFVENARLGTIADMRVIGDALVLAGTSGAAVGDARGSFQNLSAAFPPYSGHVKIVPLEKKGDFAFVTSGNIGGPTLIDREGRRVWTSTISVDSLVVADFEGTGRSAIAVGYPGGRGVSLFDLEGKELWRRPEANPWHLEFGDVDDRGTRRLINSNASGQLVLRDKTGKPTSFQTEGYFDRFSLIRWPGPAGKPSLLAKGRGEVLVLDFKGRTIARLDAPLPTDPEATVVMDGDKSDRVPAAACYVTLKKGAPPYLAVSVEFSPYNRSELYIYDSAGRLAYSELFADYPGQLMALPLADDPQTQQLLLGGEGEVLSYRLVP